MDGNLGSTVLPLDHSTNGLDAASAFAQMEGMIARVGLVLGPVCVNVSLPGWHGSLHSALGEPHERTKLLIGWRFHPADGGHAVWIAPASKAVDRCWRTISSALIATGASRPAWWIKDIHQALHDLGDPMRSQRSRADTAMLTWRDAFGNDLSARIRLAQLRRTVPRLIPCQQRHR